MTVITTTSFKPSYPDDLPFVFYCRNDPLTRSMSNRTEFIEWDEIKNWQVFIYRHCNKPVGYGRIVPSDLVPDAVDISYVIAPHCRRQGYGTAFVKALIEQAATVAQVIRAEIKGENLYSKECAKRAGLKYSGMNNGLEVYAIHRSHRV